MINITRNPKNPIFSPDTKDPWEAKASFNGSVIKKGNGFQLVYRALSQKYKFQGQEMELSTIGKAESADGVNFNKRSQFIKPEQNWEKFGLEDPRVTYLDGKYYIFYTAISKYPPDPESIKVGLAISPDLASISEKHLITPFNAKGMSLFPKKINGKYAVIFTADSDYPPSKVSIALFTKIEDLWSESYWKKWHKSASDHSIPLVWTDLDRIDVGSPPIETPYGWLVLYCTIKDHQSPKRQFQVRAVILDANDPKKIKAIIKKPILVPETNYEKGGNIPNVIFPTCGIINDDILSIYYSAGDTSICIAEISLKDLYSHMQTTNTSPIFFQRYDKNPILSPIPDHEWEGARVYNPAAIRLEGKIHLIYRGVSQDNTSSFGYAVSNDGVTIDERLPEPIYIPKEDFELKKVPNGNSGCEDPRITLMNDRLFVCYTATTGEDPVRIALTSISVKDFVRRNWNWERPVLISAPGIYDKDACLLPEKVKDKYFFLHRITPGISVDTTNTLIFGDHNWLKTQSYIVPHPGNWDDQKIGIGPTPIKTEAGWLLIYHGISNVDQAYRVGAMLLDYKNPRVVVSRTEYPLLEPIFDYEKMDGRGIAFPCGAVEIGENLFIYFGSGDKYISVAKIKTKDVISQLTNEIDRKFLV